MHRILTAWNHPLIWTICAKIRANSRETVLRSISCSARYSRSSTRPPRMNSIIKIRFLASRTRAEEVIRRLHKYCLTCQIRSLTNIQRGANIFEIFLRSPAVAGFMLEVHLLGQVFTHLSSKPCELELREERLDPAYHLISTLGHHAARCRRTKRHFDHFHVDVTELGEMRMLELYDFRIGGVEMKTTTIP